MLLPHVSYLFGCCEKHPTEATLGKNGFIFVPSPRVQAAVTARKAEQLEYGVAGHIASAVSKQREVERVLTHLLYANSAQIHSSWDAATHNQTGLPTSVKLVKIISHKHTRGLDVSWVILEPARLTKLTMTDELLRNTCWRYLTLPFPLHGEKVSVVLFRKDGRCRRESALT